MCKKLIYVISFMLILSLASNAFAAGPVAIFTDGEPSDSNWSSPANWDTYPVYADNTYYTQITGPYTVLCDVPDGGGNPCVIRGGATVNVPSGGVMSGGTHNVGRDPADGATVNVEVGGHISLAGKHFIVGNDAGAVGFLNINGGRIDGGHLQVGNRGIGTVNYDSTDVGLGLRKIMIPMDVYPGTGTLNMNGGLITHQTTDPISIGVLAGSTGTLNLNGGLIDYTSLVIGTAGSATINCNGGTLQIDGDITADLDTAHLAGKIGSTNGGIPIYTYADSTHKCN